MSDDWSKTNPCPTQSESIAALSAALAKAQGAMSGALKDAANPFFKSKYADLESVWSACRAPLAANGLAVIQTTDFMDGVRIITTLAHSSGEWIRGVLPIMATKTDPQGTGSAITYARRYALAAIVGVYQTDDDAEAAHGRTNTLPMKAVVDPAVAKGYAQRLIKAIETGIDGPVTDIADELKGHQELYEAIWGQLPSQVRRSIKDILERNKAA